jgi:hypothetical protein
VNQTAYLTAPVIEATGIGPLTAGRYVGQTNGAPTSGAFLVGDFADDPTNATVWICTASGSPGTWAKATPANATSSAAGVVEITQNPPTEPPVAPIVIARPAETELTTTSATNIFSVTPTATGMFVLLLYARVVTAATTVTAELTYTDNTGAQSYYVWNSQSLPVGSSAAVPFSFEGTASAITLSVTAGTANQVSVLARLVSI